MVFGGINEERIQLNEDTLWAGGPYHPVNPEAKAALPEARNLVFAGKFKEADRLIGAKIMARPLTQMPYETVGDLFMQFPEVAEATDYQRALNLDTAVTSVSYTANGVKFSREIFASPADQVMVIQLTADKPASVSFTATFKTPQTASVEATSSQSLLLRGTNGK